MKELGQLYIVGFNGKEYNNELDDLLENYQVGGLILFGRNIPETQEKLKKLISNIYDKASSLSMPFPFISIDHEGGRVHRLNNLATHFPSPGKLSKVSSMLVYRIYEQQSRELSFYGFNTVFSPVLDLCPLVNESVISERSFSPDHEVLIPRTLAAMTGLESTGILSVPKHFPGHGSVKVDPHFDLPIVDKSLSQYEENDLLPFKAIIRNQAKAIMSAHVLTKQVDSTYPATLSKLWMKYLKEKLGFRGLIISDDLCMKAIWNKYTMEEVTTCGLKAGLNVLCICYNEGEFLDAFKTSYRYLTDHVKRDRNFEKLAQESIDKVRLTKNTFSKFRSFDNESIFEQGKKLLLEIKR